VLLNGQLVKIAKNTRVDRIRDSAESASFRWHPVLYRLLSFGHVPSAVDWLLIRFVVDSNLSRVKSDSEETEVYRIINLATELDPAFYSLYTAGAHFLAIVRNDRVGALKLVEKGRRFLREELPKAPERLQETYWELSWRIPLIRGYLYLMEFQDAAKAAEAYSEMKDYYGVPWPLRKMAENNKTIDGQFNLAINSIAIFRKWERENAVFQEELNRKESLLLIARDLMTWNRELRRLHRRKVLTDREWRQFREKMNIPERDRMGGTFHLRDGIWVDTTTEKVPTLGIDLESAIQGAGK
jgi:hypothetical protein